jgi:hypothetical protein
MFIGVLPLLSVVGLCMIVRDIAAHDVLMYDAVVDDELYTTSSNMSSGSMLVCHTAIVNGIWHRCHLQPYMSQVVLGTTIIGLY